MVIPVEVENQLFEIEVKNKKEGMCHLFAGGKNYELRLKNIETGAVDFSIDDVFYKAKISKGEKGVVFVSFDATVFQITRKDLLVEDEDYSQGGQGGGENNLFAPMPGKVIKINVAEGEKVHRGTILLVVEAMKMENNIIATEDAVVEKVNVKEGEMVDTDLQLVFLKKVK
jgi:acetyl/propionyl-CoA carboxylase alpha subunit